MAVVCADGHSMWPQGDWTLAGANGAWVGHACRHANCLKSEKVHLKRCCVRS
jgi:hypothetical protein